MNISLVELQANWLPRLAPAPITWGLALISITAATLPSFSQILEYNTFAIENGEFWRAFTGHLVHWSTEHLIWDLCVFLILGTLCEWQNRWATLSCILVSSLSSSMFMYFALPEITSYRGLSGIDSGLFTLTCIPCYSAARKNHDNLLQGLTIGLLVGLFAKLAYELTTSGTFFVNHDQANFIPIVGVHILGGMTGVLLGALEANRPQKYNI